MKYAANHISTTDSLLTLDSPPVPCNNIHYQALRFRKLYLCGDTVTESADDGVATSKSFG